MRRVAVRLKDNVDLPVAAFARSGEGGADLGGVVAVVVHDGNAADLAVALEAAIDSAKVADAFGDLRRIDLELVSDRHGRCGIENVVAAGDVQFKWPQQAGCGPHLETG